MANPFFRFKQFMVYHDKCAMKVGTDGVLLGGWTDVKNVSNILDVGCGSGLISLMLSQKLSGTSEILAIDVDNGAVEQTKINIDASPFNNIKCKLISFVDIDEQSKYDLIVSNPPFFKDSLSSPNRMRTIARHSSSLEMVDIFEKARILLSDNGRLSLIYPFEFKDALFKMAESFSFKISRITNVRPTPTSNYKRVLFECTKTESAIRLKEDELLIETDRHVYSPQFIRLVKDFYLKF